MSRKVLLTCVLIVAVVAGSIALLGKGGASDATMTGYFADASPLEVGNEVRIAGVKVGTVKTIQLDGKVARVTLDVERGVLPLHDGARLQIKPINLLGENYVSITDGKPTAPYADSSTIPLARTNSSVNLQDVLDTFNDPTSTALAAMVSTFGDGLHGNGQKAAAAIRALAPTMNDLTRLGSILRQQNGVLDDLVVKADPVAAAFAKDNGRQLDALIANARDTLSALGDNQAAIEQTIQQLPTTLLRARQTLDNLGRVSNAVAPTLRKARPVTSKLSTISDEIVNFAKYATPAFNDFGPLFAQADALLKEAAPIAENFRKGGVNLRNTASRTRPVGYQLLHRHLGDLMSFVTKWALSTNSRDGLSHYFRGVVFVTPQAINALLGTKALPNIGAVQPNLGAVGGLANNLQGTVKGLLGGTTGGLSGLLGGLLGGRSSKTASGSTSKSDLLGGLLGRRAAPTSATGLSKTQENALLQQLIGG